MPALWKLSYAIVSGSLPQENTGRFRGLCPLGGFIAFLRAFGGQGLFSSRGLWKASGRLVGGFWERFQGLPPDYSDLGKSFRRMALNLW